MRQALVTGATGLLGSYVVKRLVEEGTHVRALVRGVPDGTRRSVPGAAVCSGALDDPASLRAAAAGCDVIINCAARIGASGSWSSFEADNVGGVRNLIEAADAGCRVVHVSSTAVFGPHRYHDRPTDETFPLPELAPADVYGRSKQDAEKIVLAAHRAGRVQGTVVRPPVMYGNGDRRFIPWLGAALKWRVFPLIAGGSTTLSVVHADAVADGAVRAALEETAGGRVYHLANDFDLTAADLVRYWSSGSGRRILTPRVPLGVARSGFAGLAWALTRAGRPTLAQHAHGLLQMLTRNNPFSSERARIELGWSPRIPHHQGIPDAVRAWLAGRS